MQLSRKMRAFQVIPARLCIDKVVLRNEEQLLSFFSSIGIRAIPAT
jgi:hypothetical protein